MGSALHVRVLLSCVLGDSTAFCTCCMNGPRKGGFKTAGFWAAKSQPTYLPTHIHADRHALANNSTRVFFRAALLSLAGRAPRRSAHRSGVRGRDGGAGAVRALDRRRRRWTIDVAAGLEPRAGTNRTSASSSRHTPSPHRLWTAAASAQSEGRNVHGAPGRLKSAISRSARRQQSAHQPADLRTPDGTAAGFSEAPRRAW